MSHEHVEGGLPDSLEALAALPENTPLISVALETVTSTNDHYQLFFVAKHPSGPYVKLDSPTRTQFTTKGQTEEEAQQALLRLTHSMQDITGGLVQIHPFEGAVMGVTHSPLIGNVRSTVDPEGRLSTIILLTDKREFNTSLTNEALSIGPKVLVPSSAADWRQGYQCRANSTHPLQAYRDQSIMNGLGGKWDIEFALHNTIPAIPPTIDLTPLNVARTMRELHATGVLHNTTVRNIFKK